MGNKKLIKGIILSTAGIFFILGAVSSVYYLSSYGLVENEYSFISPNVASKDQFMRLAFSEGLPQDLHLLNPPVKEIKDLQEYIDEIKNVKVSEFFNIYDRLTIEEISPSSDEIVKLSYKINQENFNTYAYYLKTEEQINNCSILLIPGSGDHQSLSIYNEDGYHGTIRTTLLKHCDIFILIKPNNGYRSIHNEKNRLDADSFLYANLLNEGYSYSATYITEALAWVKYMQKYYNKEGIIGLSQGGFAAFLTSLQSSPDFTIVSSGFSLYQRELISLGFNQIIIPGLYEYYKENIIQEIISKQNTKYLFTYGGNSDSIIYSLESEKKKSCLFLKEIDPFNVFCFYHQGGHFFPEEDILAWIEKEILN
ncbi:MAG: hypothetical protein WCZ99_00100 [Candidatus Paceibacterota bacterium]|nr:hypothetical protein [Candidatus Paceibacterota bacterium]MDD4467197.1 hypothetical protein [Candidatus Paceibacterota bacterium]